MATYTITEQNKYYTTLGLRVAGDIFNINGGGLIVDCDTRYGYNGATAAYFGNITISATLGGTITFDSRKVRLIPFGSGSGTVPAADTVISRNGASGKLIGVYANLTSAPLAAAAAMPTTGFIKIREWNSTTFTVGTLTGISASSTGADEPGWIEVVGVNAGTVTANRLGQFIVRGDFYYFRGTTTSGTRTTGYQIPTNGSTAVYVPGVEVETSPGSNVYEFYPCAGTKTALLANIATDPVRGKFCWVTTSGVVYFGYDGTNSTGGYCPEAGCKVRVPNIFFVCCVAAASVNILPNATLATRYDFTTIGGGVIDIQNACMNWYLSFSQAYNVKLSHVYTFDSMLLTECATAVQWDNVGVGQSAANTQIALNMSYNFEGGVFSDSVFSRTAQAASGAYIISISDCNYITFNNVKSQSLTKAANAATGSFALTRVNHSSFNDCVFGGGRAAIATCTDIEFNDSVYYDNPATTTDTAIPMAIYGLSSNCINNRFSGLSFGGLTMVQPYTSILNIAAAGCQDIYLRNIGTYSEPLDLGGSKVNATWSNSASTTINVVTPSAHGLKVNDIIYVIISSNTSYVTVGNKTVTAVGSATTFTFTNTTGTASGTLTYYPVMTSYVAILATNAAAKGVKIQRVYTKGSRTGLISADNSSFGLTIESAFATIPKSITVPSQETVIKQAGCSSALTAQTAVYGTHFFDFYNGDDTTDSASYAVTCLSSTVGQITKVGHGFITGQQIFVTYSEYTTLLDIGAKTVTVTGPDTFTIPILSNTNAGNIEFTPINGRVAIQMNEPSSATGSQVTLSGSASFTAAGSLYMPAVGDTALFKLPYKLLGHSRFIPTELVMAGGTLTNYTVSYCTDGTNFKAMSTNSPVGSITNMAAAGANSIGVVYLGNGLIVAVYYNSGIYCRPVTVVDGVVTTYSAGLVLSGTGNISYCGICKLSSSSLLLMYSNGSNICGRVVFIDTNTYTVSMNSEFTLSGKPSGYWPAVAPLRNTKYLVAVRNNASPYTIDVGIMSNGVVSSWTASSTINVGVISDLICMSDDGTTAIYLLTVSGVFKAYAQVIKVENSSTITCGVWTECVTMSSVNSFRAARYSDTIAIGYPTAAYDSQLLRLSINPTTLTINSKYSYGSITGLNGYIAVAGNTVTVTAMNHMVSLRFIGVSRYNPDTDSFTHVNPRYGSPVNAPPYFESYYTDCGHMCSIDNNYLASIFDASTGPSVTLMYSDGYTGDIKSINDTYRNTVLHVNRLTDSVSIGDYVFGTNIKPNTRVTGVWPFSVMIDIPFTSVPTGTIRFSHLPLEMIPDSGIDLWVKIRTIKANTTAITSIYANTYSSDARRQQQYPLDMSMVSVTNLVSGSRVKAYRVDNSEILFSGVESGGTVNFATEYVGNIMIEARKSSSSPYYMPWTTQISTISGSTVYATALQQLDM